jgi:hypothetical protein
VVRAPIREGAKHLSYLSQAPAGHSLRRLAIAVAAVACLAFAAPSAASAAPQFNLDRVFYDCDAPPPLNTFITFQTSGSGFTAGTPLSIEFFYPDGNYSALGTFATVQADGTFTAATAFSPYVEGTYRVRVFTDADKDLKLDEGGEAAEDTFTVTCAHPLPTTRQECDKGDFQVFKNRGDCVAFVSTKGKNEPGQNVPGSP